MRVASSLTSRQATPCQAGGPIPAEQRDRIYRDIIERLVGYKLLVQEAKARNVAVSDAEVTARIDEVSDALAGGELALFLVFGEAVRAAALLELLFLLAKSLDQALH